MNRPLSILITGAGAPGTPGTTRCLVNNGERKVRVFGCDANPLTSGSFALEGFEAVPRPDDEDYLRVVTNICLLHGIDVILPQTTAEVEFLSRPKHRNQLHREAGTVVAAAPGHAVSRANDKATVMDMFHKAGIPAPEFQVVKTRDELQEALLYFGDPCVVKPRRGNGSRGVRIVREDTWDVKRFLSEKPSGVEVSAEWLLATLSIGDFPELIVMEYLPGDEYSVDVFYGLQTKEAIPRLRKSVRDGICTHAVVEMDKDLIDFSLRGAVFMGLFGAFGFQYVRDEDGVPRIIECNPRVQGTMVASLYAGLNCPWLAVKEAITRPPDMNKNPNTIDGFDVEYHRLWDGFGVVNGEAV